MGTTQLTEEAPGHFREVAKELRDMADKLDSVAETFEIYKLERVEIPLKAKALEMLLELGKWESAAVASLKKAKIAAEVFGPDPRGTGPKANKPLGPRDKKKGKG